MTDIQKMDPTVEMSNTRKKGATRAKGLTEPLKHLIYILANRHLFTPAELRDVKAYCKELGIALSKDFDPLKQLDVEEIARQEAEAAKQVEMALAEMAEERAEKRREKMRAVA